MYSLIHSLQRKKRAVIAVVPFLKHKSKLSQDRGHI